MHNRTPQVFTHPPKKDYLQYLLHTQQQQQQQDTAKVLPGNKCSNEFFLNFSTGSSSLLLLFISLLLSNSSNSLSLYLPRRFCSRFTSKSDAVINNMNIWG